MVCELFSSLKKRDTVVKRKATEGDDIEKTDKSKAEENDAKSDNEKEPEKKKGKKSTTADSSNESEDKKETESTEDKLDESNAETNEMLVDKSSDNEDDEKKGDEKEKRKKFVRLWCVHCRIESATFKVNISVFFFLPFNKNIFRSIELCLNYFFDHLGLQ